MYFSSLVISYVCVITDIDPTLYLCAYLGRLRIPLLTGTMRRNNLIIIVLHPKKASFIR